MPLSAFWRVRKELNDSRGRGCAIVQASLGPGWPSSIPGSAAGFLRDLGLVTYLFFSLAPESQRGNPLPVAPLCLRVRGGRHSLVEVMGGGEHVSTGDILRQRAAIFRRVLAPPDPRRAEGGSAAKPVVKARFHLSLLGLLRALPAAAVLPCARWCF